jgi:hypothetical protein
VGFVWEEVALGRGFSKYTLLSTANSHSTNCSTFIETGQNYGSWSVQYWGSGRLKVRSLLLEETCLAEKNVKVITLFSVHD